MIAAKRYDYNQGTKFLTYAWYFIKGKILREIEGAHQLSMSRDDRKWFQQVKDAREYLRTKNVSRDVPDPTDEEVAEYIGETLEQFYDKMSIFCPRLKKMSGEALMTAALSKGKFHVQVFKIYLK